MRNQVELETPEGVVLAYPLAGIGARGIALIIDTCIGIGLDVLILIGAIALSFFGSNAGTVAIVLWTILQFILFWGYFILFETFWRGQTPGKRLQHVRVIRADGTPIGFTESFIRNLVRLIDAVPAPFYAVGIITMFISKNDRRLGDMAAGTIVVRERPAYSASDVMSVPVLGLQPELGEVDHAELTWDLRALRPSDLVVANEYLARAPVLPEEARVRIGQEIATRLATRIGAEGPRDPAAFLRRIVYLRDRV